MTKQEAIKTLEWFLSVTNKDAVSRIYEAIGISLEALRASEPRVLDIEVIAEAVHNAWWKEKIHQGHAEGHPDAKPYAQLSESVKEYDRVTAREVLKAIGQPTAEQMQATPWKESEKE